MIIYVIHLYYFVCFTLLINLSKQDKIKNIRYELNFKIFKIMIEISFWGLAFN
jgi:hypothetical protein